MSDNILNDRRNSLEEAFFAKHNRELQKRLHEKVQRENAVAELREASTIEDEEVLGELVELGIGADTLAALGLVPLVQVAWADGHMDAGEKEALLRAAAESGIESSSPAYELLAGWLEEAPGAAMMAAWKDYVAALTASCSASSKAALEKETLGRAQAVAEAAGGFVGLGKVSGAEKNVLLELAEAFS